jgi:hypothetical protein
VFGPAKYTLADWSTRADSVAQLALTMKLDFDLRL